MNFGWYFLLALLAVFAADVTAQAIPRLPIYSRNPVNEKTNETIKFVITFPSIIQKSKDFAFNLILFQEQSYTLPVQFKANLTANGATLATQTFTQTQYGLQSHTFTNIKSASLLDEDSYPNVQITFNSDALKNYTDIMGSERVLSDRFVFIQTDKAIYKPTHTVNMRAVVINRDLTPVNGVVNVTLTDAKSNQLKMWSNEPLTKGVFSGTYKLSDFVTLGDWKITLVGKGIPTNEKSFTVQQYVLPKYEVKLDFTSSTNKNGFWLFNADSEDSYQGFVRAKYTFGKPVKGSAIITLKTTGGCSFAYDYPNSYYYSGRSSTQIQNNITKLIITIPLAGDGSPDDGKFKLLGTNKIVTYNPYSTQPIFIDTQNPSAKPSAPAKPQMNNQQCQLTFQVNVTEELTGEKITGDGSVVLYRDPYKITVHESVQKTLKPGLPFTMRFQISTPNDQPVGAGVRVDQEVYFFNLNNTYSYGRVACGVSPYRPGKEIPPATPDANQKSTTDSDGLVSIKVTVPKDTTTVLFKARVVDSIVDYCDTRSPPQSDSKQSISIAIDRQMSVAKTIPKVGDRLTFKIEASFRVPMVYFLTVQNGQPLQYKQLTNPSSINDAGSVYSVDVTLPQAAAPRCAAVVWTVENTTNEILADAIEFKVDGLLRQNVSASFSPATVHPRDPTTLTLSTSEANSYIALLAVDKSVRLLKSGNDITLNDVLGAVGEGSQRSGGYRPVMPLLWRCWRCGWWPWWIDSSNAESVFSGVGMIIKSNVRTGFPFYPMMYARGLGMARGDVELAMAASDAAPRAMMGALPPGAMAKGSSGPPSEASVPPTVRMLFPETWLWNNTQTNEQGKMNLKLTAPDTITSWVLTAFSIGDENGFGAMDDPAELTVFQDFFVNLDISRPTIIRGEQVQIKAVVFNYQTAPASVDFWLKQSDDFEVSLDDGVSFSHSDFRKTVDVPANGGNSIPVWVKPKRLGNIKMTLQGSGAGGFSDAMEKEVLVEPEGEVRYANKPVFIRLTGTNNTMASTINVARMLGNVTDDMVVEGSKMFQLQTIGDILGPALSSLGNQIRLPTGCGEQTMVILAPNVYIYNYLKSVNLLTDELSAKTTGFVDQGYQRELTYQRNDGGFSAFGNSDTESSTWLTAFVVRCFAAAKKYVHTQIPDAPVNKAWTFLARQAQKNGTFAEPGRVLHHSMKGGSASGINLAAYIYTTAAEADVEMAQYTNTRSLIINAGKDTRDSYQLALISYALSIRSQDRDVGREIMRRLLSLASSDGNVIYWKPENDQTGIDEYEQSGPTQIETSAYALLAHLNLNGMTDDAIPIGRWLMSQRNSLGGFASTQDTVVGLQAIAELAARLISNGQTFTVDATLNFQDGNSSITKQFTVNSSNAQLLQSFDPPRDRQSLSSVDLSIRGVGVGLVQLAMRYNVQNNKVLDSGDYNIIITREAMARKRRDVSDSNNIEANLDKLVTLKACARPINAKPGMVLLEVGVPTGFEADLDGTQSENKKPGSSSYKGQLKRIELGDRKVVFYFDTLESSQCVNVKLTRTLAVKNVQSPIARVYSYYEPARINATEFAFPGMAVDDTEACQDVRLKIPCPL